MTIGITKSYTPTAGDVSNASSYNTDLAALFNAFSGLEAQTATLGGLKITPSANSASVFSVTNAAGTAKLTVDTTNSIVTIPQLAIGTTLSGGTPTVNTLYKDNLVKAWISFTGAGTIAIVDSFNVDSITDNDTGDYTVTWDTDFGDAKYAVVGSATRQGAGNHNTVAIGTIATGTTVLYTADSSGTARDATVYAIAIGLQS